VTLSPPSGDPDIRRLYEADRRDHAKEPRLGTKARAGQVERDRKRRAELGEIISRGGLREPIDHCRAAAVFLHGETVEEMGLARQCALACVEGGYEPGRRIAAEALDRWLMLQGSPQKFGTQTVPDGTRFRLWDVEPATTEEERAEWGVPSLAELETQAEERSKRERQPPLEAMPAWLQAAVRRWSA
jgi:hypothetical protein